MKRLNSVEKKATILFADLIGSSEVASLTDTKDYLKYLGAFKKTFEYCYEKVFSDQPYKPLDKSKLDQSLIHCDIKGDEGFLLISSDRTELDISNIFNFALLLKITWLLNKKHSIDRLKDYKKPFEIAIGINTGFVNVSNDKDKGDPKGYAINLSKRIESESRKGKASGIYISEYTYATYSNIPGEDILRFEQVGTTPLKGISGVIKLYELNFFNIEDVAENEEPDIDPTRHLPNIITEHLNIVKEYFMGTLNPWLGNIVCNIYWTQAGKLIRSKKIKDAKELLDKCKDIAWKLIESDSQNGIWKIYLSQIIYDYITEIESEVNPNEKILYIEDIIKLLESVERKNPEDLDAKLYLGKYNLLDNENEDNQNYFKIARSLFEKILLWKKSYYDAEYFIAASYIPESKKIAIEKLSKFINDSNDRESGSGIKILNDALQDYLFKDLKKEIKELRN